MTTLAIVIAFNSIWIPSIISAFFFLIAIFGNYDGLSGGYFDFSVIGRLFNIAVGVIVWLIYFSIMYFVG